MGVNLAELRAKSDKALMDFLESDLNLGFTFARLSLLEQGLDEPAAKRARHNAEGVIETVTRFRNRIVEAEQVHAIESRLAELELLVSQIQSQSIDEYRSINTKRVHLLDHSLTTK